MPLGVAARASLLLPVLLSRSLEAEAWRKIANQQHRFDVYRGGHPNALAAPRQPSASSRGTAASSSPDEARPPLSVAATLAGWRLEAGSAPRTLPMLWSNVTAAAAAKTGSWPAGGSPDAPTAEVRHRGWLSQRSAAWLRGELTTFVLALFNQERANPTCDTDSDGYSIGCAPASWSGCRCHWSQRCYPRYVMLDGRGVEGPEPINEGTCGLSLGLSTLVALLILLAFFAATVMLRAYLIYQADLAELRAFATRHLRGKDGRSVCHVVKIEEKATEQCDATGAALTRLSTPNRQVRFASDS